MDYDIVILKPAELILKSKLVRARFEKQLLRNVKYCLKQKGVDYERIVKGQARYFIYSPDTDEVVRCAKLIFGVSKIAEVIEVGARIDAIKRTALDLAKDFNLNSRKSFGVRSSRDLEMKIGEYIQKQTKAKVNLTKPDLWIRIDVVGNRAYIFSKETNGLNGLPLGTSGNVVVVIKEPQDVLAGWLMMRRGCEVYPIVFKKVKIDKLKKYAWGSQVKPLLLSGGFSIKLAEKYATEVGAGAIVLGSTKPKLLKSKFPVLEPLVGLEEKDIKRALKKL